MSTDATFRAAIERDPSERLTEDDQATRHEAEFVAVSLLQQRLRAAGQPAAVQGVCTNCEGICLPLAVYCDEFCRDDHERRLALAAREGRAR